MTYSNRLWAVIVKDRFYFKLLPSDGRIRDLEINEKLLVNNNLQRLANTDTFRVREGKEEMRQEIRGAEIETGGKHRQLLTKCS